MPMTTMPATLNRTPASRAEVGSLHAKAPGQQQNHQRAGRVKQRNMRCQPELGGGQKETLIDRHAQGGREHEPPAILADQAAKAPLSPHQRYQKQPRQGESQHRNQRERQRVNNEPGCGGRRGPDQNHKHHMQIRLEGSSIALPCAQPASIFSCRSQRIRKLKLRITQRPPGHPVPHGSHLAFCMLASSAPESSPSCRFATNHPRSKGKALEARRVHPAFRSIATVVRTPPIVPRFAGLPADGVCRPICRPKGGSPYPLQGADILLDSAIALHQDSSRWRCFAAIALSFPPGFARRAPCPT